MSQYQYCPECPNTVSQVQDSLGGLLTSTYDGRNELVSRQFSDSSTTLRFDLTWDARGLQTGLVQYSNLAGTTVVGRTTYTYDNAGRMATINASGNGTVLASYVYGYDPGNRLATEKIDGGATTTYGYDDANEVTADNVATYTYDAAGNRNNGGFVVGTGNQLANDGTWTYTYDAQGNLIEKSEGKTPETWVYTYNTQNQMISAEDRPTPTGTATTHVDYKYDALGRLVEEDVTQSGTTTVQRYAYDGQNIWADLNGSNALATRRFFTDKVNGVVARAEYTTSVTIAWYLTDRLGTVRDIMDNSGGLIDHRTYDAYGNILTEAYPTTGDAYGFAGGRSDLVTGEILFGARWYDPASEKWTTVDPSEFDSVTTNFLAYAGNSPTNYTDPSGLDPGGLDWSDTLVSYLPNSVNNAIGGSRTDSYAKFSNRGVGFADKLTADYTHLLRQDLGLSSVVDTASPEYLSGLAGGQKAVNAFEATSNYSAAVADTLTAGGTQKIRAGLGYDNVVDKQSAAYRYGGYTGQALNIALIAVNPAGWAALGLQGIRWAGSASSLIDAGQAAWNGDFRGAGMFALNAGLNFVGARGAPCGAVTQAAKLAQKGLHAYGIVKNADGAVDKFLSGDYVGGLLDLVEAGVNARRFLQSCFTGKTKLLTKRGWIKIKDIRPGDYVRSKPENNPEAAGEWKLVEEVFERLGFTLLVQVVGQVIETTAEHPVFVRLRGWIAAGAIEAGDEVLGKDGEWTTVERVERTERLEVVYNCRVAEYHTYFVGGEEWGFSVWAHNADCVFDSRLNGGRGGWRDPATGRIVAAPPQGAGQGSQALDQLGGISKAQQRLRSGSDRSGRRIIDDTTGSQQTVRNQLNRPYDPSDWQ